MKSRRLKRWLGLCGLVLSTVGIIGIGVYTYTTLNVPQLILNGDATEKVALNSAYTDKGVKVIGFGEEKAKVETVGNVDTEHRGTYTIEYHMRYGKKTVTVKRTVTVEDVTPPEIELLGEAAVTVSKKSFFEDPGVKATDNLDGDISSNVSVSEQQKEENVYIITYTVEDSDGNRAEASREVRVQDIVKPIIKLNGKDTMVIIQGNQYNEIGATAQDDVDGDISSKISVSGEVDTSKLGTQTVKYTVKDSSGNTASAVRSVTVITKEAAESSVIYLTFDDGPSSKVTPRILDILKKNNVKATFFILNYSEDKKPLLQRMIDEGHTIGIHGFTHDWSIYKSEDAFIENIVKLNDKLYKDFGYRTNLIRFPGGSSNTVSRKYSNGIMTRLSKLVMEKGYIYYDWNVSSNDAVSSKPSTTSYIVSSVTEYLRHGRNNIVLMHDTNAKSTTADGLQQIIDYGRTNGYRFAPLTDAIPPVHHKVNN